MEDKVLVISVKCLVVSILKLALGCLVCWALVAGLWNHWDSTVYVATLVYSFVIRILCNIYIKKYNKEVEV